MKTRILLHLVMVASSIHAVVAQGYTIDVVASTASGFSSLDLNASVNDSGLCAFTGRDPSGVSKAFVAGVGSPALPVTFGGANRDFLAAAINNQTPARVVSRERVIGSPTQYLIRKWNADGSGSVDLARSFAFMGQPASFDSVVSYVDINDGGVAAFSGLVSGSTQTRLFAGTMVPPMTLATYPGIVFVRPQISNDNRVVFRDDVNRIRLIAWPSGASETIAGPASGFSATGMLPGISRDGQAVAWIGDRGAGKGVFVAIRHSGAWVTARVAGEGDPAYSDFLDSLRASVHSAGNSTTGQELRVVYGAVGVGAVNQIRMTRIRVNLVDGAPVFTVMESRTAISVGDMVGGASMTSFSLFNPQNAGGQIVFGYLAGGVTGVALATPRLIECIDANDPAFLAQPGVLKSGPQDLAVGGTPRLGAAADGHSKTLLRLPAPGPGSVTFEILNPSPGAGDGELGAPSGGSPASMQTVNTVMTSAGARAVVVWTPPSDFVRNTNVAIDEQSVSRSVLVRATWTPAGGGPALVTERVLSLRRPPVVLCHGLWADSETWNLPILGDPRFSIVRADYRQTNARPFQVNAAVAEVWSTQARETLHAQGYASAQVDWIGHSMGGLLGRVAFRRPTYRRSDNFQAGDFHKLITLNSPHWGSPLANLLAPLGAIPVIRAIFDQTGHPIDQGAIESLSEGSFELSLIGPTTVPSHAISGNGGSVIFGLAGIATSVAAMLAPPPWSGILRIAHLLGGATTDAIYRGEAHDLVVLESSQHGGLNGTAVTSAQGVFTHHLAVTGSTATSTEIVGLLNARLNSNVFASGFPAPNLDPSGTDDVGPPVIASGNLSFTLPAPGSPVAAGLPVSFQVSAVNGLVPTEVTFFFPDGSFAVDATAPYTASWTPPANTIGTVLVDALAQTSSGALGISLAPLPLQVTTTAALQALQVSPDPVHVEATVGAVQLSVRGTFSDGVARDLTNAASGTTYTSSNPLVVAVSPNGLVTALSPGLATILVANGGISRSINADGDVLPVTYFGAGFAGSGGLVPSLSADGGFPQLGNAAFSIVISQALGGATALLGLSVGSAAVPLFAPDALLLIDLAAPNLVAPLTLNGAAGVPGAGMSTYPVPVPNIPSLVGFTLYGQGAVADAGSVHGWSLTNGIRLTVVP